MLYEVITKKLYDILNERDSIYTKEDFSEEDGLRAAELEEFVSELGGYEAEANAATLLSGLGIDDSLHNMKMKDLPVHD